MKGENTGLPPGFTTSQIGFMSAENGNFRSKRHSRVFEVLKDFDEHISMDKIGLITSRLKEAPPTAQ